MAKFRITDGVTGKSVIISGESEPTQEEAEQIFVDAGLRKQPQVQQPKGFVGGVSSDIQKRGENIQEAYRDTAPKSAMGVIATTPERLLNTIGQGAGAVGDVVMRGVSAIIPESVKTKFSEAARESMTPRTKQFYEGVSKAVTGIEEEYPRTTRAAGNVLNILGVLGSGKAAKEAGVGVTNIVKDISKKTVSQLDDELSRTVRYGIEKGIRPSVVGNYTAPQNKAYIAKAKNAVETIIDNKNSISLIRDGEAVTGVLPQSLDDFRNAIDQTKRVVFTKYNTLAKQATGRGVEITGAPIAKELNVIINNKAIRDFAPDVADYARKRAAKLSIERYSAEQAQDAIQIMNKSLEAFYANPTYDTATKAYIDSLIVNNLRNSLDDAITRTVGPGYQEFRKSYGALKSIEKDVNRRAIVDARKNVKGLVDFTDVFSGGVAVDGILSLNPARVGQAVAMSTIKNLVKRANDPNRIVRKMFESAEKLKGKMAESVSSPKVPRLGKVILPENPKVTQSPSGPTMEFPIPEKTSRLQRYLSDVQRRQ